MRKTNEAATGCLASTQQLRACVCSRLRTRTSGGVSRPGRLSSSFVCSWGNCGTEGFGGASVFIWLAVLMELEF